jgi:hypothetical protein
VKRGKIERSEAFLCVEFLMTDGNISDNLDFYNKHTKAASPLGSMSSGSKIRITIQTDPGAPVVDLATKQAWLRQKALDEIVYTEQLYLTHN